MLAVKAECRCRRLRCLRAHARVARDALPRATCGVWVPGTGCREVWSEAASTGVGPSAQGGVAAAVGWLFSYGWSILAHFVGKCTDEMGLRLGIYLAVSSWLENVQDFIYTLSFVVHISAERLVALGKVVVAVDGNCHAYLGAFPHRVRNGLNVVHNRRDIRSGLHRQAVSTSALRCACGTSGLHRYCQARLALDETSAMGSEGLVAPTSGSQGCRGRLLRDWLRWISREDPRMESGAEEACGEQS